MNKNILIIGPARSRKTSLAKLISKKYGYSLVSIDNIVSSLEAYPSLEIGHNGDEIKTAINLAPFLMNYFVELSEGNHFYDGVKFVIEGTHIDFEQIIPFLTKEKLLEKYVIIGLTYNDLTPEEMFENIKKYDTEDDWTYWISDEKLKNDVKYFLERNKYYREKLFEYKIKTFDVSHNRIEVLNQVCKYLEKKCD